MTIGSQGISDNRKITPVKDILPGLKVYAQSVGVVNQPTTTSTSYVPLTDMTVTLTVKGTALDISFTGMGASSATGTGTGYSIFVNGVQNGGIQTQYTGTTANALAVCTNYRVPVAPGTHLVQIFWLATGNTATSYSRVLTVREV